jgi:hypothetical protein
MLGLIVFAISAAPAPMGVDFDTSVKPVLVRHCLSCHGPQTKRAGLRLDTATAALEGGASGPALVPGNSRKSLLIRAMAGEEGLERMPPRGDRVTASELATVAAWIDAGARPGTNETVRGPAKPILWSLTPPKDVPLPAGEASHPIDLFVRQRLAREKLSPSPEADKRTLLVRVALDLTGLPPAENDLQAFLADNRPNAFEHQVDRLLASPHYGERWGRWWLDQARYADSNGYSIDGPRTMWQYRNWVINALNADMPFNQFATEQLAGDLLPSPTVSQKVATGFHRNTMLNQEGGIDLEQFRVEAVVDRANTTATVFLGLTLGCAQCHDHKFDPISQKDYYRFLAFFNSCDEPTLDLSPPESRKKQSVDRKNLADIEKKLSRFEKLDAAAVEKLEGQLSPMARLTLPDDIRKILEIAINGRTPAQHEALVATLRRRQTCIQLASAMVAGYPMAVAGQLHLVERRLALGDAAGRLRSTMIEPATALILEERKEPRQTHVMLGGDFTRKGAVVEPGVPAALPPLKTPQNSTRLDLARWLFMPGNPLAGRVLANRVWQVYFGTGLVETENDFGTQGSPPTHPELLDWMALQIAKDGYSLKQLHRLIVTSATYRQSSRHRADLETVDARNRLLARQSRLRLEAELLRDRSLAASGLLDRTIGGPSVFPSQPTGVYSFTQVPKQWKTSPGSDRYRRGMYTFLWRSAPHPGLALFDAPDAGSTCTRRHRSTTPLQALTLLNDASQVECAKALALNLNSVTGNDNRIQLAFRRCFGRQPTAAESSLLNEFLSREMTATSENEALIALCRVILNSEEFLTRE